MMRFTLAGLALALSAGSALAQNPVQQFNMIGVDYLATISRSADGTRAPCQPTEGHRPADGSPGSPIASASSSPRAKTPGSA